MNFFILLNCYVCFQNGLIRMIEYINNNFRMLFFLIATYYFSVYQFVCNKFLYFYCTSSAFRNRKKTQCKARDMRKIEKDLEILKSYLFYISPFNYFLIL